MAADDIVKNHILSNLREFYPLKVDETVLISAVQRSGKNISADQISKKVRTLAEEGMIDQSTVKAPFGTEKTSRFKITTQGMEYIQSHLGDKIAALPAPLAEIEARLAETYDGIKADMEKMRQELTQDKNEADRTVGQLGERVDALSEELSSLKSSVHELLTKIDGERASEEKLVLGILAGDEKTVYDLILRAGGEMLQKDLVIRAKMSNAKISRTVDHLESRGILSKERHGATNRLRIQIKPRNA